MRISEYLKLRTPLGQEPPQGDQGDASNCPGNAQKRRWVPAFIRTYYNGYLNEASIRASYRPSQRLSFDFSQQWDGFRLPIWRRLLIRVRQFSDYCAFSRFLTLSTIFQVNTSNTQAASAKIRLRSNYRLDSDLFVVYTVGMAARLVPEYQPCAANPTQFTQNRFAIKYTYSLLGGLKLLIKGLGLMRLGD